VISPHVRRRRLAAELLRMRDERGWSADELCRAIGIKRQTLSRLENARVRPDQNVVMKILDHFGVQQPRFDQLMAVARDAQQHGWWETYRDEMGPRQALYADLEAGAAVIAEYNMTLIPGLLQIPAFTEARAIADLANHPTRFTVGRAIEARATRQRILNRPGGPSYEAVIEEAVVRRPAAAPEVVRAQLDHLVDIGHHQPNVTIRVLPLTAPIGGHAIPRSAFYTYRYPDPADPVIVAVDTITSDLLLTEPTEVDHYLRLFQRLREAALSPSDSLDFLAAVAQEMPDYTRR
jgi:transcriptional regulator with XRE-family HTH domain